MKQINLNVTPEFEKDLQRYMKKKGIPQKSEALRQALREAVQRLEKLAGTTDFQGWRGMALKTPLADRPRFKTEDDLWT